MNRPSSFTVWPNCNCLFPKQDTLCPETGDFVAESVCLMIHASEIVRKSKKAVAIHFGCSPLEVVWLNGKRTLI